MLDLGPRFPLHHFILQASDELAPVLFYGTSIVNGHVASRPGMIFTNVLSRALRRPVINLGFGGQGTMDPSIGQSALEHV